jgi:hypothetical protein
MQTPQPSLPRTPPRTPQGVIGTPPRTPQSPISCRGLLFPGRGGVSKPLASPEKSPPPKPKKPQKKRPDSEIYAWLHLLKHMTLTSSPGSNVIGKGDFGTVHKVHLPNLPGTPPPPPIAVKEIKFDTQGVCSNYMKEEVARLGSPGCVPGVACRTDDSARIFMPLGVSLDKLHYSKMAPDTLEWLIKVIHWICKTVESGVVADLKPANLLFLLAGTPTVVKDAEGQPCMGPPTQFDQIVVCDLGTVDPTSGGTKKYGVLPSESDAAQPDFEARLRNFKATMLEALIRDAAKPSGKTVEEIVAQCVPEGWAYAAGVQHQAQAQQLLF